MTFGIPLKMPFAGALVWLGLALAATGGAGALNYYRIGDDFEAEARTLHRVISQRADQHEAHLTSLAAILASPDESFRTLRAVAEAVERFYPRIRAIEVLVSGDTPRVIFSTHTTRRNEEEIAAIARNLAPGQTEVVRDGGETYFLVKGLARIGAQDRNLVMSVDGRRLVEPETPQAAGVQLVLKDPSGREIVRTGELGSSLAAPAFIFEKVLGSRSQPLLLSLERRPPVLAIISPLALALAFVGSGLTVLIGFFILRERRTAREARERAGFHEQEARLAHAMRVNTVGEMASGIAHELTQPLTAILSQSQAGLRLAQSPHPDRESIIGVLEANARLATRAGAILARLRAYVSNKTPASELTSLNDVVRNVVDLAQADFTRRGVSLALDLSHDAPAAMIDRVSIEQVVHNLVRNAAEAVESLPEERRAVTIATALDSGSALIVVKDDGPGVSAESLPRVFEPFFTTKRQGMGLGLPLCERLVEAFGGQVSVANQVTRGAVLIVRLPAVPSRAKEAAE